MGVAGCGAGVAVLTCSAGVKGFDASVLGTVCTEGSVSGFGASVLGAVCTEGSVSGFGASVLGAVCSAGFVCAAGVTGFGVSALGATVLFTEGAAAVPVSCGFAFTATSAGIVLGTG